MNQTNIFDVLVAYTESVATSSSSKKAGNLTPFSLAKGREHYSIAYAYFLRKCLKSGLRAAFTTSKDIIGPGTCKSYWEFKKNKWHKVNQTGFASIIFDKVSPLRKSLRKKRDLVFSSEISLPFNDPELLILFNDKLKTFQKLKDLTLPTVNITKKTIINSLIKLDKLVVNHKNKSDFSKGFVLKDRFGAGGLDIYRIDKNPIESITRILKEKPKVLFVLQPFANFDKGYQFNRAGGYTDIRIIYSQGKIIQRYIRTAKESDFRCNEHQGGKVIYINQSAIPKKVNIVSNQILKVLDTKKALFALDFIVSNDGNVYLLEGNINPGIYWGLNSYEDKVNTKKLIRIIVKELKRRTDEKKISFPDTFAPSSTYPRLIPQRPLVV